MSAENRPPETLVEAIRYFSDPDVCLDFFVRMRWPNGVVCPRCGCVEPTFISTRRIWKCKGCKQQFSVKVGTVMEDSPLPLDKWIAAFWMICNDKNGVSSYEIHRGIGVTQKSAWFLLHRIRLAMQTGTFETVDGAVEVDETFIGGKARNMHKWKREQKITGRGTSGKTVVLGILKRRSLAKLSQVRMKIVPDTSRATIQPEVRKRVKPGSEVYTDEHGAYTGLEDEFVHEVINHAEAYARGKVHTNGIENFWSLVDRCLGGTYVSVEPYHLFRYLDEQAFRFNQRETNDQGRFLMAAGSVAGKRLTYRHLTGKDRPIEEQGERQGRGKRRKSAS